MENLHDKFSMVMELINDEHDRLAALAAALEYWTSPKTNDPDGCQNPTAWRLAQLLDERLSSTEHIATLRRVLGADSGGSV